MLALIFLVSLNLLAAPDNQVQTKIDQLLKAVENSDCTFIRNGSDHTPKEAAGHMRRKYDHFKKQIKTPEQFIEKCASKSELSGKAYSVKLPDGKVVKCEDWMNDQLKKIEASSGSPAK